MDRISGLELSIGRDAYLKRKEEGAEGVSFKDMLTNAVGQADNLYQVTQADTQALLSGEVDNIAQVMINGTKSELALNMVIQVRNKIVDAYNELIRMQV